MGDEDLEATDDLCEGYGSIVLPILDSFHVVHKDNIVLLLALVVDFGLMSVSTSHGDGVDKGMAIDISEDFAQE